KMPGSTLREFGMSVRSFSVFVLLFWILSFSPAIAQIRGPVEVIPAAQHDVSAAIGDIPARTPQAGQRIKPIFHIPHALGPAQPDPVVQTQMGTTAAPTTSQNFEGVGQG